MNPQESREAEIAREIQGIVASGVEWGADVNSERLRIKQLIERYGEERAQDAITQMITAPGYRFDGIPPAPKETTG